MVKRFVLDTNVLLHNPDSLLHFEDNDVIIPIYVIEELDTFKRDNSELGRNARHAARHLDRLRHAGSLMEGVPLENGGTLRVAFTDRRLPAELQMSNTVDNMILAVAVETQQKEPSKKTVLVSKDITLRLRADGLGLEAQDFDDNHRNIGDSLYSGFIQRDVDSALIDKLYAVGALETSDFDEAFKPNIYIQLNAPETRQSALAKFDPFEGVIRPVDRMSRDTWGLMPLNREQKLALDALNDPRIKLVTLLGKAGTGKTLLAIAAGLHAVTESREAQKLLVARPVLSMGKDLGYLPGSLEEKLNPWMKPIYDNVEFLLGLTADQKRSGRGAHELIDQGLLEIEPLSYIRGRTIPNQFMVIDESQNLTPHEVKTIITRAGEGTRIVLTGDPYQI
ncbi:MAG: PhoH family protein, partial [Myxococcota bacterium]|nr:PhoH family protein [Myxococcota bacterium]